MATCWSWRARWGTSEAIAEELRIGDAIPALHDLEPVTSPAGYDAAIIGGAVYVGQTCPSARSGWD